MRLPLRTVPLVMLAIDRRGGSVLLAYCMAVGGIPKRLEVGRTYLRRTYGRGRTPSPERIVERPGLPAPPPECVREAVPAGRAAERRRAKSGGSRGNPCNKRTGDPEPDESTKIFVSPVRISTGFEVIQHAEFVRHNRRSYSSFLLNFEL